tara:strand:+ start:5201 stop:5563 length:363 start_codon:yes stop_codon:yes gene_type:complete
MGKKTVVIGASNNPQRYAWMASERLQRNGHEVVAVGIKNGECAGIPIHKDRPQVEEVDTVTMYVGPQNQPAYYDYILSLNPERIIFNPGTENMEFMRMAKDKGIEVEAACTLVMLAADTY